MAIFSYNVKTPAGKIIKGSLESDSKTKALEYLHGQGYIILSLKEGKGKKVSVNKN